MNLKSIGEKMKSIGNWAGRVLGAVAPFIPDPKAKLIAGAASAALNAATDDKENVDEGK
jgi:hypothetical protein